MFLSIWTTVNLLLPIHVFISPFKMNILVANTYRHCWQCMQWDKNTNKTQTTIHAYRRLKQWLSVDLLAWKLVPGQRYLWQHTFKTTATHLTVVMISDLHLATSVTDRYFRNEC
jgi:hypothetical protein